MDAASAKVSCLIPRLTEKNYAEWNQKICAMLQQQKLWKYTQSAWGADKGVLETQSDWEEKTIEAADLMTPTITAPIQLKLTEDEFNDGYKMYKRLKELLQPSGEIQFMRLTREYYTLNYRSYKDMYEFLDHVKSLEEQIDATNVEMTPDNRTLLCLTMALWNESRYRSLLQIWGVTKDMTAEKAREMLLEDEQRDRANSRAPALMAHGRGGPRGTEKG